MHEKLPVNIVSAFEITHNNRYEIVSHPDGTLDVYDTDGNVFYVRWRNKTLMIDIDDVWSPMNSEQINVNINGDGTYEDLMLIDEEFDEPNVYFDDEIHMNLYQEEIFNRSVDF